MLHALYDIYKLFILHACWACVCDCGPFYLTDDGRGVPIAPSWLEKEGPVIAPAQLVLVMRLGRGFGFLYWILGRCTSS